MKKSLIALLLAVTLGSAQAGEIIVGGMSGAEGDLLDAAAKVAKDKYGLDVEVVRFEDYVQPNLALNDGDIDANAMQHVPYLDTIVAERDLKIKAVANTFVYPLALYSKKVAAVADLKDGAVIGIPSDPSNGARALILLDKHKLLKLKDNTNLQASVMDIAENPLNLEIKEIDAAQLPGLLADMDAAVINSNFAVPAGMTPENDGLIMEAKDSPYVNVIAVRDGDETRPEIQDFIKSFQSPEVNVKAKELFKGAAVKGW